MSYMSNLNDISSSLSGILQGAITNGIDALNKLQKELFNSDDAVFARYFKTEFIPSLYDVHAAEQYTNCVFCSRLTRCSCHKHCLKCSKGTYIRCSPLLPGILCYERASEHPSGIPLPWLYKEPCSHFVRLEKDKYYRNLLSHTSWVRLYNFEVLEGISNGLVAGEKPCHICASVDYEIYKDCIQAGRTRTNSPCFRIADIVGSRINQEACL